MDRINNTLYFLFILRNRVKDDELGQLIDGPGNVIILSNISSNGYDPRSLFSRKITLCNECS